MFEAGHEDPKPPVLLSLVFSALAVASLLFLVVLGDAVYGMMGHAAMVGPHVILATLLSLAALVFGVVAIFRSLKHGTRRSGSVDAAILGALLFLALAASGIYDLVSSSSRARAADATPPKIAAPSGPLRVSFPANGLTTQREVTLDPGVSQQVIVPVPKDGYLTVRASQLGFNYKMLTTKDVQTTSDTGFLATTARVAGDIAFEVRNDTAKQQSAMLKIEITPH